MSLPEIELKSIDIAGGELTTILGHQEEISTRMLTIAEMALISYAIPRALSVRADTAAIEVQKNGLVSSTEMGFRYKYEDIPLKEAIRFAVRLGLPHNNAALEPMEGDQYSWMLLVGGELSETLDLFTRAATLDLRKRL